MGHQVEPESNPAPDDPELVASTHLGSAALARYQSPKGAADYSTKYERSKSRRKTNMREHEIAQSFLAQVKEPHASLLNIPCGAGRFSELFHLSDREDVMFADFSSEMLDQAGKKLSGQGVPKVKFVTMDVTKDQVARDFDLVFCIRLLHHMKTRELEEKALDFICKSSREWLILTCAIDSTFKGWSRRWRRRLGLRKRGESVFAKRAIGADLAQRGFDIIDIQYVDRIFSSQAWLLARRVAKKD